MKFKKKPVIIEARQITDENINEVREWCGGKKNREILNGFLVPTLEGAHIAKIGDWIIKGIKGEFYPCKPDIFEATYERIGG